MEGRWVSKQSRNKNRKDDDHEMMTTKRSSRVATARDGRTSGVKDSMSLRYEVLLV